MKTLKLTLVVSYRLLAILALCSLLPAQSWSQVNFINLTSLATNTTTSSAQITIAGVCSSANYTVVNSSNLVIGDTIPSAFGKVNSDFAYVTNELVLLAQLPYEYNTNLAAQMNAQSNWLIAVTNSQYLTNQLIALNQTHSLTVSNDLFNFFATNTFIAAGAMMNFDSGLIASDGSGNINLTGGSPTITSSGSITLIDGSGTVMTDNGFGAIEFQGSSLFFDNAVVTAGPVQFCSQLIWSSGLGAPTYIIFQQDTLGHGGTTFMLNASNNGTPMYLHVTSAGVATWTTSP